MAGFYCDPSGYKANGGSVQERDCAIWLVRASGMIDRLTHGRAEIYADKLDAELEVACTWIADLMANAHNARCRGAGLSSASNDGYSESYADPLLTDQALERACYAALADALGADRYGLLYAGVM